DGIRVDLVTGVQTCALPILSGLMSWTALSAEPTRTPVAASSQLSLAVFDIDATPPIGSMMAYDPVTNKWELGLRARGVVLLGAEIGRASCRERVEAGGGAVG